MKKIIMMITSLFICLFVFMACNSFVYADEVTTSEPTTESEPTQTTESEKPSISSSESSSKTTTEPEEPNDEDNVINITQEDIDKIIEAAKQGNIDEVKNLLIGTIGFTSFTILMALIYLVKMKLKQANESKLLENASESTNENIKALANQLNEIASMINLKMDGVETNVKNYYQALNSEKVEEATKKAEEIAKALEVAMNLNNLKTSEEETPKEETQYEVEEEKVTE